MASAMDMASRRVLGHALGEYHDAQLAYGVLAMAVAARGGQVSRVIMHIDQGSQNTAGLVRQACARLGIRQSMGKIRKSKCPRFWGTLQDSVVGRGRPAIMCSRRR